MTDEEDATGSNPTTAVEETVEVEIGIARSATTRTSPSAPSATVAVNLGAMLEAHLETTAEVDLTDATTTAVAVSTVGVDATATVAATKRSPETGPATTAAPTISPAAPHATSADPTLRTVAVTDAVATDAAHAKAEASVAEIDGVAIDEGLGNLAILAGGTAVGQGRTGISGKRDEATVTVVAATDAAHGRTVATVERAVFDPRGPSVRLEESQVATRTTAGRNPSAERAGTTIEGESHGRGRVPRCP